MSMLRARWSAYLDRHHRYPHGPVGWLIGERMRHQHMPETIWSIALLQLQPRDRVAELGFGVGHGLARILDHISQGHVTGMDLSATMIRAARRRNHAALAAGRLELLRGDIVQLPFHEQQFDKILSIHTFYFWPDPGIICRQLSALLRPGGRLVSTFATAHTPTGGPRQYWPLHHRAQVLVQELQQLADLDVQLAYGPDSRQYNNVAIVITKH